MSFQDKRERNYGIDLLRILCMFMVLLIHLTGPVLDNTSAEGTYWSLFFIKSFCLCAVNCYAIISGYVKVDSKFKFSNLMNLWLTVCFYTVSITLLFFAANPGLLEISDIIKSFLPVSSIQYWYFSSYFLLFFLMPVINAFFINSTALQQKTVLFALLLMSFGGSALNALNDLWSMNEGYSAFWLFVMYYLGAYIKKNPHEIKINPIIIYFICTSAIFILEFMISEAGGFFEKFKGFASAYISPFVIMSAVSLVLFFLNTKISEKAKNMISFFTPLSFSVYIIHYNKNIWGILSGVISSFAESPAFLLIPGIVLAAFIIFAICSAIDCIRLKIFVFLKVKQFCAEIEKKACAFLKLQ